MTAQLPLHLRPAPLPTSLDRPACCPIRTPVLEVADLSVAYGGHPALRDATLSIHRGCITAVVGPSGCGKSTFLSALNRMTDLVPGCTVTGRVTFDGSDVHATGTDTRALRRRVGMIFQKPNPFPLTILENVTFPLAHHRVGTRSHREAIAEETLRRVGLWDEVRDRLGAPARSLSGGQQQRLCLARALALDPEVLLLDEPCSALDPIASGVVEDLVARLRGRVTVVIVTHNLAQARRIADDVAVFWTEDGAGTVVEAGPAAEVLTRPASAITAAYVDGARG